MYRITIVLLLLLLAADPLGAQSLELTDCRISAGPGMPSMKARCGTLTRPLDPSGTEPAGHRGRAGLSGQTIAADRPARAAGGHLQA